ncbi:MAG TPA: zinc-binding dehydrogenase [Candidatus Acidoferrum sp.]|nr:zinc-binding dehydrogenase [Candidatus Acidoferrum sp.]
MKAAVLYGKEDVRVEHVDEQPLAPGEVRLHVEAALTCGTDLKVFKRGYHARMIVPPAVFGHEMAGIISESRSLTWRAGDRVVVANSAPCGECLFCRQQQENLCDHLLFLNGAYAESIIIPERLAERNLMRLKPHTPFRDAALTEPLACVVLGIEDCRLRAGHRVLVIGAGPIGLMFVALAKELGCEVFVAGRGENRLEKARTLGASVVVDVTRRDLVHAVRDAIQPEPDVVFEAVGKPETWEAATQLVRKGGLVNFFGGCPSGTTVSLDTARMHYSSISTVASFHHTPRTIRRALKFIEAGVIRAENFVDGECLLDELPAVLRQMTEGNRAVKTFVRTRQ